MKNLIERKKLDHQIALDTQKLIEACEAETKVIIDNRINKLKIDIENLKKQKTHTEKLQMIAELKRPDLTYVYYVENGFLYNRNNTSGLPNKEAVHANIDGLQIRVCLHEIIPFITEYRK